MKHALILGSNGFLGQHLATELMRSGVKVTGYGRSLPVLNRPDRFIQGDFTKETDFSRLLAADTFDVMYHLISTTAPTPGTGNALREIEENLAPTIRLLNALRGTGCELIFASSGGTVYGESVGRPSRCGDALRPICSYGMQKAAIENFLRLYDHAGDVRCKICRISNPYGVMPQHNRTQGIIPILLQRLLDNQPITLYGETVRDYIFISDLTDALIAVADYRGGETLFNVGTGIGTGLHELTALLERYAGQSFTAIRENSIRDCDVKENVLDILETTVLLNWKPRIALEQGLAKTLRALQVNSINLQ